MTGNSAGEILIDKLTFQWAGSETCLFDHLSLKFSGGKTVCLIGPNGSGKTTLLELVLGWRSPSSGTVSLGGRPVVSMTSGERGRLIALVPQEEKLTFSYSVLEYVLLGRAPHLRSMALPGAEDRSIAMNALEQVGIRELYRRAVPQLSGGEMRLVLIARALVQQPRILLLDEPTNYLDPANRELMLRLLGRLKEDGITLVMSSHEPDMITRLADDVVLIGRARPPEIGSASDMIVPAKLTELYGVQVRIVEAQGRQVILWGP
jgi:iron complex transport system ATP-binding protein